MATGFKQTASSSFLAKILAITRPDRLVARLLMQLAKHRSRRALAYLDQRLLEDIGLTEEEARRETDRGFWQG